jgi:hypothetical protein
MAHNTSTQTTLEGSTLGAEVLSFRSILEEEPKDRVADEETTEVAMPLEALAAGDAPVEATVGVESATGLAPLVSGSVKPLLGQGLTIRGAESE